MVREWIGFGAEPRRHITVSTDDAQIRLIHYHRGREFKQHVVIPASQIIHLVRIVATRSFAGVCDPQAAAVKAEVGRGPSAATVGAAKCTNVHGDTINSESPDIRWTT